MVLSRRHRRRPLSRATSVRWLRRWRWEQLLGRWGRCPSRRRPPAPGTHRFPRSMAATSRGRPERHRGEGRFMGPPLRGMRPWSLSVRRARPRRSLRRRSPSRRHRPSRRRQPPSRIRRPRYSHQPSPRMSRQRCRPGCRAGCLRNTYWATARLMTQGRHTVRGSRSHRPMGHRCMRRRCRPRRSAACSKWSPSFCRSFSFWALEGRPPGTSWGAARSPWHPHS